jgi:hypothetical protein
MAVKLPEGENSCEIDLTMSGARTDLIKEMYPDKGTIVWTPEKENVMLQWGKARHGVMRPQDRIKNRYTHQSESVSSKKSPTSNNSHPMQNNDADEIQVVVAVDPQLPSIMGRKRDANVLSSNDNKAISTSIANKPTKRNLNTGWCSQDNDKNDYANRTKNTASNRKNKRKNRRKHQRNKNATKTTTPISLLQQEERI